MCHRMWSMTPNMINGPAAPIGLLGQRALGQAQQGINQALERLSTGQRLTRASVDPAAIIAVSHMQADVMATLKELEAMERNNSRLATQEAAAGVVGDMLVELDGLSVQAANTGAMSDAEREGLQIEADSIVQAIDHVANISGMSESYSASALGLDPDMTGGRVSDIASGGSINLMDGDVEGAQTAIRNAVQSVAESRAKIGMEVRENQSMHRAKSTEFENLSGAISVLADADFAKETSALARGKVLEQASIAGLMAEQSSRARVLDLLA